MQWSFYACVGIVPYRVDVLLTKIETDECLQVTIRHNRRGAQWERCTTPRYVRGYALELVKAGIRSDNRMPAWAYADVLQENGIPDQMCEVVRESELCELGSAWRVGREDW